MYQKNKIGIASEHGTIVIKNDASAAERLRSSRLTGFLLVPRPGKRRSTSGLRISDATILARESISGRRVKLYTAKTGAHVSMLLPQFVIDALALVKSRNPK